MASSGGPVPPWTAATAAPIGRYSLPSGGAEAGSRIAALPGPTAHGRYQRASGYARRVGSQVAPEAARYRSHSPVLRVFLRDLDRNAERLDDLASRGGDPGRSDGRGARSKNTADQFGVQTDLAGSLKIEQVRRGRRGAARRSRVSLLTSLATSARGDAMPADESSQAELGNTGYELFIGAL